MLTFSTENAPNPSKLIDSLRYLGYNNYSALADIVDNSLDAEASKISVVIRTEKGEWIVTIADNGKGMNIETLDQALRLGSMSDRNIVSDLGKFGMGLVTASLSMCRRTEVITRQNGGAILHSVVDVDEIKQTNKFCKFIGEANLEVEDLFNELTGGASSGTVVRLTKCDHIQNKTNASMFSNNLKRRLGEVYRVFLATERSIKVNGDQVSLIDPLMLYDKRTEIQSDEQHSIKYTDEDGVERSESFRIRVALLPDFGGEGNKDKGMNIRSQGFYVLRNYRQIASGETLGVFQKHNDFNRVRAELYFPASLDKDMGVNFTKQEFSPTQAILDKIKSEVEKQFSSLRKRTKSARVTEENEQISHDEASKLIGQKANLLIKPKIEIEKRRSPENTSSGPPETPGATKQREQFRETQQKETALPLRFETVHMGAAGAIYDAYVEGKVTVIQWNIDHAFYQRFILDNQDNPGMITASDFLVYSLASAELRYAEDDDAKILIENIRSAVSSNMRALLS